MIRLYNVSKYIVDAQLGHELVLRDAFAAIPTDRPIALLGNDPRVLTQVLYLLTGSRRPDRGAIVRDRFRASPLIQAGGVPGACLHPQLTGAENIRILADIYGVDPIQLSAIVEAACRFGPQLNLPVKKYDWPMRRNLEITLMASLPFDCYFVDQLHAVHGALAWRVAHAAQMRGAGFIFSTQRRPQAARIATMGVLVRNGAMKLLTTLEEAAAPHEHVG